MEKLRIDVTEENGVEVIRPQGRLTFGAGDVTLHDRVQESLDRGARRFCIDFSAVTAMDSSGVGELMASYSAVNELGGTVELTNVSERIAEVLEIMKLSSWPPGPD